MVKKYSKKKNGEKYISPHFQVKEFACTDGADKVLIDVTYVKSKLEKIRAHFGKPVHINSGYRTLSFNSRCGGISNSAHCHGRAFDISIPGVSIKDIARYAEKLHCRCIIRYDNLGFVHIDSRDRYRGIQDSSGRHIVRGF